MLETVETAPPRLDTDDRSSASFLVRVWYEARESDGGEPAFRGYIKNLQTGDEHFVRHPADIGEAIGRSCGGPERRKTSRDGS